MRLRPRAPFSMSGHVQPLDHRVLVQELKSVQWDTLGINLGLSVEEIQEIELDHQTTSRRRSEMLNKWLKKELNPTWLMVVDALEKMSENRLANRLRNAYDAASPAHTPSASSEELELTIGRNDEIARAIEDLSDEYFTLIRETESAVKRMNPSLNDLKRFSQFYIGNGVSTVDELFDQLKPFNLSDYKLLQKIVKAFLLAPNTVDDKISDYVKHWENFKTSTTIRQFTENIEQAQQSHSTTSERPGLCTIKLRLVGGWMDRTMDNLEKLVNELFEEKRHVLSHLKIVRGSVIVTFSAPLSEVDSLLVVAREHSSFSLKVGVSQLVVADIVITQSESSDFSFESSLLDSVKDNDLNLLNFLLSINTDPDGANDMKQTGLMWACFNKSYKAVALLLKANANPDLQRFDGLTALNIASQLNLPSITKALLEANADPNIQSDDGITPLMIASEVGNVEIVDLLLKAKADPDIKDEETLTPLFIASQKNHTEIVGLLLKANANHNIQTCFGETPLDIASQVGHIPAMTLLLRAGADPSRCAFNGETPLLIASARGHSDAVAQLLKAKANPDSQREDGVSALYIASQNGHATTISLLLKANADPNLYTDKGETPLFIASLRGYSDIVALLLEAKANCNFQTDDGITSLYIASQNGHAEIVTLLLNADADPNLKTVSGQTPLHIAIQNGYSDIITLLLGSNVNPNLQTSNGTTPLMSAIVFKKLQAVQVLLVKGADPNLQHSSGVTALMFACQAGYLDTVELLMKYGADPSIKSDGLTAPKIAADRGHKDIVDLLEAMNLSQPSTTSPALTANEIASEVFIDNRTMTLLNKAKEKMLVKKVESFIATECKKRKEILPPKEIWSTTVIGQ